LAFAQCPPSEIFVRCSVSKWLSFPYGNMGSGLNVVFLFLLPVSTFPVEIGKCQTKMRSWLIQVIKSSVNLVKLT